MVNVCTCILVCNTCTCILVCNTCTCQTDWLDNLSIYIIKQIIHYRYCDCFANGEFCRDSCNCQNCKNSLQYEEERARAVKVSLQSTHAHTHTHTQD